MNYLLCKDLFFREKIVANLKIHGLEIQLLSMDEFFQKQFAVHDVLVVDGNLIAESLYGIFRNIARDRTMRVIAFLPHVEKDKLKELQSLGLIVMTRGMLEAHLANKIKEKQLLF